MIRSGDYFMFEEDSDEDDGSSDPLASERGDPDDDSSDGGDGKVDPFQVNISNSR